MPVKKLREATSLIQLSLQPFIRRSREIITFFEEPFYRTNNPMGYAVLMGIMLGCLLFMMLKGWKM